MVNFRMWIDYDDQIINYMIDKEMEAKEDNSISVYRWLCKYRNFRLNSRNFHRYMEIKKAFGKLPNCEISTKQFTKTGAFWIGKNSIFI